MSKRILIVEDQREKSKKIRECLRSVLPDHEIVETRTILVAGQLLGIDQNWSGIVLDLAFQRTQQVGGHLERPLLAGLEVMQQLNEMRLPWPVIIATQHASFQSTKYGDFKSMNDLRSMLKLAFPGNYRDLVEVDLSNEDWRGRLASSTRKHFK